MLVQGLRIPLLHMQRLYVPIANEKAYYRESSYSQK